MGGSGTRPRVLLLTSSPLEGGEGADKRLATAIANGISEAEYMWFTRWWLTRWSGGGEPGLNHGRRIPVVSPDGVPHLPERFQAALAASVFGRRVGLVHAVMTVGHGFPFFSRLSRYMFGPTPVIHTVPGVMDRRLLGNARPLGLTVALSETTARELRAAGFGDVRVVPPAIALEEWPGQPRGDGTPVVLFAGHYDAGGGAPEALAAAGAAARAGARFRLVLAMRLRPGQDQRALAARLMAQARAEALAEVEILGHVADMRRLLVRADVLLFPPSALNGKADVPLTVLEAMATGRPVILSDLPEFAILGGAVLRVPVGDAATAGGLLAALLDQPRRWDEVAAKGRTLVRAQFGTAAFVRRYRQLYREVTNQAPVAATRAPAAARQGDPA